MGSAAAERGYARRLVLYRRGRGRQTSTAHAPAVDDARGAHRGTERGNNQQLIKKLKEAGHKVVVMTNYPYVEGITKEVDAVICNFSASPDSIRISARLLFGAVKTSPSTKMPIHNL